MGVFGLLHDMLQTLADVVDGRRLPRGFGNYKHAGFNLLDLSSQVVPRAGWLLLPPAELEDISGRGIGGRVGFDHTRVSFFCWSYYSHSKRDYE